MSRQGSIEEAPDISLTEMRWDYLLEISKMGTEYRVEARKLEFDRPPTPNQRKKENHHPTSMFQLFGVCRKEVLGKSAKEWHFSPKGHSFCGFIGICTVCFCLLMLPTVGHAPTKTTNIIWRYVWGM